jgi:hypothetical protein
MRFWVRHLTAYEYSEPVRLGPQWLRLRPCAEPAADLVRFALDDDAAPLSGTTPGRPVRSFAPR